MTNSGILNSQLLKALSDCKSVLAITGAGVSAESGIPTYRGISGLYNRGNTVEGYAIEDILSAEMLAARPELTWKYLREIGTAVSQAKPNRAHQVLALMERHFDRFCLLTQNIDGFHKAAGSQNLIEIHGNLDQVHCMRCPTWTPTNMVQFDSLPPRCSSCQGVLRPQVVLFGEMLPTEAIQHLEKELAQGFDAVFSIGTTSVFPYIQAPVRAAAASGNVTVEINPDRTVLSDLFDFKLNLPAGKALDAIWRAIAS